MAVPPRDAVLRSRASPRDRGRILRLIALGVLAADLFVLVVPVWPAAGSVTFNTTCTSSTACRGSVDYIEVCGPICVRFAGTWSTNGSAGSTFFAVARGSLPAYGCLECPGIVYTAPSNAVSGTFDVRYPAGSFGSIYLIAAGLEPNNASVVVHGTAYRPLLEYAL